MAGAETCRAESSALRAPSPPSRAKQEPRVLGTPVLMKARARLTGCRNDTSRDGDILHIVQPSYGISQRPDSAERNNASTTAMFLMESSSGTGTSPSPRIAFENASPWMVYWSQMGNVSVV